MALADFNFQFLQYKTSKTKVGMERSEMTGRRNGIKLFGKSLGVNLQRLENFSGGGNRFFDFRFGDFGGHEKCFKLTARKIKSAFQHAPEKLGVTISIACRCGCPVGNGTCITVAAGTRCC